MKEEKEAFPWWITPYHTRLSNKNNLLIFSLVFLLLAAWTIGMFFITHKPEAIIYGVIFIAMAAWWFLSWLWLKKNKNHVS